MNDKELTYFFENQWGKCSATYYPPRGEPELAHPGIVFVHGFRARKEWYRWIGERLSSNGYAALLFTVPSPNLPNPHQWADGIKSAIDYLINNGNTLINEIDSKKIGVMGHSMGGLGALIAGSEDPRVKCVVGLAPAIIPDVFPISEEIYHIATPIQFQIGSNDGLIPTDNVKTFLARMREEQKSYIEIEGGNHIRFMDRTAVSVMGEYITQVGILGKRFKDLKANIAFNEQHAISSKAFLQWFDQHLKP